MWDLIQTIIGIKTNPDTVLCWGPAATAIFSAAASIGGGILGNEAQKKEARANRRFQERMSNTSHYREVEDLKAAGLNPMLSVNNGASTPTGGQADLDNVGQTAVTTALEAATVKANNERTKEEISLLKSQKHKTDMEALMLKKNFPEMEVKNFLYEKAKSILSSSAKSAGNYKEKSYSPEQQLREKALERLRNEQQPINLRKGK